MAPIVLCAGQASAQDNVLIILADDLGVDQIGVYQEGAQLPATPTIDALAANGVLFRNAWTNPICTPTRACIHTGRYGIHTGIGRNSGSLPTQTNLSIAETTLPELLDVRQSGYAHAAIGKWHLNKASEGPLAPNVAGWSHFAGLLDGASSSYFSWPRTVDGVTATSTVYATTQMIDDALAWIQTAPEPWVVYLAPTAPHAPFHEPPAELHSYDLTGEDPNTNPGPFYKAMVEALDTEIGRMLGTMDSGVRARTNVFFLGDNGSPGEGVLPPFILSRAKSTLYEGGINVPLIVSGPVVQSPGREESALVSAVDLFATVAELCGVQPVVPFVKIDSVSFVPHLQSSNAPPVRSFVYAELFPVLPGVTFAIRDANYKLIRNIAFVPPQDMMFDLAADPFEQINLMTGTLTPQQQASYDAMLAELAVIRDLSGSLDSYGTATCVGSNGNPTISGTGSPVIGGSYQVHLQNGVPTQPAILLLGDSNTSWAGIPLPFPLIAIGSGPGCFIYNNPAIAVAIATSPTGDASVTIPLPAAAFMVSGSIYHSWLVIDTPTPSNPRGLTASNGLEAVVGQ